MEKLNLSSGHLIACGLQRGLRFLLVLSILFISGNTDISAQSAPPSEYALKAVFLYNFAHFVDWPPKAFPDSQTPLVIGVLGDDPFGIYLDETVRDEKVNGRALVVKRYRSVEEIQACHVLYISRSESGNAEQIIEQLNGRSILTVSDAEGFDGSSVIIRFAKEQNKIRLKINVETAKKSDLKISSKLLRLADIVGPGKE